MKSNTCIIVIISILLGTNIAHSQWVGTNLSQSSIVSCIATLGSTIVIGTQGSGVFRSTNNGTSWTAANTGLPANANVNALAVSGTNVFAGTGNNGVFVSRDSGSTWVAANTGLTYPYVYALAVSGTNVFAGTYQYVFFSTNSGTNWTGTSVTPRSAPINALSISGTNLFAACGSGVFLSVDNGTTWVSTSNALPTNDNVRTLALSGTNIFAGTVSNGVFLSNNNGTSWNAVNAGLPNPNGVIAAYSLAVSGTNVFAGLPYGGVYLSTDNGTSWTTFNTGLTNPLVWFVAASGTNLFAGTASGEVWRRPLSDIASMAPPTLALPSDGATSVSLFPVLNWNASAGATSYELQVSTNPTFSTIVVDQSNIAGTSFALSDLANNTLFYWRVNATNARATTFCSNAWRFTTFSLAPPILASPSNSATGISISLMLNWNASAGATSYELQVSTNPTFSTTIVDQSNIAGTSFALSGLANNTRYYWRVNASNSHGRCSFSAAWSFTTAVTVSITPNNLSFGSAPIGTSRVMTSVLKYGGRDTLHITNIVSMTPVFTTNLIQVDLLSSRDTSLTVRFSPATTEQVSSMIFLFHNLPTSPETLKVSGMGLRVPIARFAQKSISFGSVLVGTCRDVALTISNVGAQSFQVANAISSHAAFGVRPTSFSADPGQSVNDSISFVPLVAGPASGLILFFSNSQTSPDTVRVDGIGISSTSVNGRSRIPPEFWLDQNYPNPFNPSTTIRFELPGPGNITLRIFNTLGQEVTVLLNGRKEAGYYEVTWDASSVPSGIYFYRLQAGEFVETKKMILSK